MVRIAVCLTWATASAQTPDWRYAAGSRINLRASPQAGSPVLAVLEINAKLQLIGRHGAWCEVRRDGAERLPGHVACELLALEPLRLEDVEAQLPKATAARLIELTARAFWLSPSLARWERHGSALEQSLPNRARFEPDPKTGALKRPPMAEFEAMKAYLASGRLRVDKPGPMPVDVATGESAAWLDAALRRVPLPPAVPSYFGVNDLDALVPSGWTMTNGTPPPPGSPSSEAEPYRWTNNGDEIRMIDAMAKRFGSSLKVTVTEPASINRADQVDGFWDVGAARLQFAPGAAIEVMGHDGKLRSLPVAEIDYAWGSTGCLGKATVIARPLPPRGTPGMDALQLAWVGRKPAAAQASIASRQRDGKGLYDRLVIHTIDIDGDRQPDFIVYEGRYKPQVSAAGLWKAVYANVAGRWSLVFFDQDDDCT